jgi:hypothetical protein
MKVKSNIVVKCRLPYELRSYLIGFGKEEDVVDPESESVKLKESSEETSQCAQEPSRS